MNALFAVGAVLVIAAAARTWMARSPRNDADTAEDTLLTIGPTGGFASAIAKVAAPVARTRAVPEMAAAPMARGLQQRLVASGMFGGNVEVFIAYQIAAVMLGVSVTAAVWMLALPFPLTVVGLLLAFVIAGWPFNTMNTAAQKRSAAANNQLPEFIDLLLIGVASSMSIRPALAFTVSQVENGPVVDQTRWLLEVLDTGSMDELAAFTEAGRRVGSTDAAAFFAALGHASISGAKVSESLERQAESLRTRLHQERRARVKKLPVTLVVAFAAHFLPAMFAATLLPLLAGFNGGA